MRNTATDGQQVPEVNIQKNIGEPAKAKEDEKKKKEKDKKDKYNFKF